MSRCKWLVTSMVLASLMYVGGCSSLEDNFDNGPVVKKDTLSSAVKTSIIEVGGICGDLEGILVDTGIDENANGVLDADEIDKSEKVCYGEQGIQGPEGPVGPEGPSALFLLTDADSADCANGGVQIDVGIDVNGDGKLTDEIDQTDFICRDARTASHMYKSTNSLQVKRANLDATISAVVNTANFPVISFNVKAGDAPYTTLTVGDLRVVIADIIPAGTSTIDLDSIAVPPATKTYGSDYLENWMYETGTGTLDTSDAANGNYVYTGVVAFGDVSASRSNNNEYADANKKRIYVRVSSSDADFGNFGATFDIAAKPVIDTAATQIDMQDQYVTFETCKSCHGEQMDNAAHASSYYTISCGGCHSPLSGRDPNTRAAFTASMIHRIHAAIDIPEFPARYDIDVNNDGKIQELDADGDREITAAELAAPGREQFSYSKVTYPKNIKDCTVCHTTVGADVAGIDVTKIDNWKNNPTAEVCSTCHIDSTLSVNATTGKVEITHTTANLDAPSGTYGTCGCHGPNAIVGYHAVTTLKSPDKNGNPVSITPAFKAIIAMSGDLNNNGYYDVGEIPVVTVTTDIAGADYTSADFTGASLYVYGPRAKALPVLTPYSTTDTTYTLANLLSLKAKDADGVIGAAFAGPVQSHNMMVGATIPNPDPVLAAGIDTFYGGRDGYEIDDSNITDPQVQTTASGFKYQLQAIPANLEPGTYMVQVAIGHISSRLTGSRNYKIDGWALTPIQVGTPDVDLKVSGDCTACHTTEDWGSMYHRSYFGTDGCLACHDQSGNHADPIANRVHAVHAASAYGDLLGLAWNGSDPEIAAITYPQSTLRCETCHDSGNESYKVNMSETPCIGCHGEVTGQAAAHMEAQGNSCGICHATGKSADINN